jgi:2-C-methyl-D-erythritol 4-phosphate cytidylyltransferase
MRLRASMEKKCIAIVLAAGKGKRMKSAVQKQFLELQGKPILYYSLNQFQQCTWIDEIIIVTGKEDIDYCRKEITEYFELTKVRKVIAGGRERYDSVYEGLKQISSCDYVFIHDGARPFIDKYILSRALEAVKTCRACAVGMPVKDTIKVADTQKFATDTPARQTLWQIQTPQVFDYKLVKECYDCMMEENHEEVTDDAMVVETYSETKVKLVEGSYSNIKITTPEDLIIAEALIQHI